MSVGRQTGTLGCGNSGGQICSVLIGLGPVVTVMWLWSLGVAGALGVSLLVGNGGHILLVRNCGDEVRPRFLGVVGCAGSLLWCFRMGR